MTRAEMQDAVAVVLGIHATPERIDTIMHLADAYALGYARECVSEIRRGREKSTA